MKFAARLQAEPGWYALLSRDDGSIVSVEIKEWGIAYENAVAFLIPLDSTTDRNIMERNNFLQLIDPNDYSNVPAYIEKLMEEREARKTAAAQSKNIPQT